MRISLSRWNYYMTIKDNQRAAFAASLHSQMLKNKNIWVVTGDLGYGMWDRIRDDFPDRYLNVGASEQAMMGIAIGLALEGKIPFTYSITTFLLYRPFETIRNYINYEKIPVKLVGAGRDKNYLHDGISHWPLEEKEKNISKFNKDVKMLGGYAYTDQNIYSAVVASKKQSDGILKAIRSQKFKKPLKILDVGSGDGTYTFELYQKLSPKKIVGFDYAEEGVRIAKKKIRKKDAKRINFLVSSVYVVDKKIKEKFDVAVVRGVLHHQIFL